MFDRTALDDLVPAEAIDAAVAARRAADRAEADLLAIAVHYVDVSPVVPDQPAAGWADRRPDPRFPRRRSTGSTSTGTTRGPDRGPDRSLDGVPDPLAGDGTPDIAEYAVEELAAAL